MIIRFLIKEWLIYSLVINYFLIGSFIVKFPIFGFHYWLPVAHVEASTIGSIILAGVLLKLGSVGLLYVVIYINFIVKFHWLGLGVVNININDFKIKGFKNNNCLFFCCSYNYSFLYYNNWFNIGKKGAIYIIFYHGFISPLIFWVVGILAWWKTRSLIVIKLISFSYVFLLCIIFFIYFKYRFSSFYRIYKRNFNIEIFSFK